MDTLLNLKNLSYLEMISLHSVLERIISKKAKELIKAVSYTKITDCIVSYEHNGITYKSYYAQGGTEIWRMNGGKKEELVDKTTWIDRSVDDVRLMIGSGTIK